MANLTRYNSFDELKLKVKSIKKHSSKEKGIVSELEAFFKLLSNNLSSVKRVNKLNEQKSIR